MLLAWFDARKGAHALERRLYRLLSVVQEMDTDEATTLAGEIESLCRDFDQVAECMRGIVTTHRRISALSATAGRTPEERALFDAKVVELRGRLGQ